MSTSPKLGSVGWMDLTVPDAMALRDFYKAVAGWTHTEVDMGGYSDFCLHPSTNDPPVAGICHARGENEGLPPQWLMYITVKDVDTSAARCVQLGGKILAGPRSMGGQGRICVIEDPAGAVAALFSPAKASN